MDALAGHMSELSGFQKDDILGKLIAPLLRYPHLRDVPEAFKEIVSLGTRLAAMHPGEDFGEIAQELGRVFEESDSAARVLRKFNIVLEESEKRQVELNAKRGAGWQNVLFMLNKIKAAGFGEEIFAKFRDEIELRKLKTDLHELQEDFGDVVLKGAAPLIQSAREITKALRGTSDTTKELIVDVGALAAGYGVLRTTLMALGAGGAAGPLGLALGVPLAVGAAAAYLIGREKKGAFGDTSGLAGSVPGFGSAPGMPIEGRAAGGPVRRGDLTWVGERGPELVRWGGDGTVLSAAESQALLAPPRLASMPHPLIEKIVRGMAMQLATLPQRAIEAGAAWRPGDRSAAGGKNLDRLIGAALESASLVSTGGFAGAGRGMALGAGPLRSDPWEIPAFLRREIETPAPNIKTLPQILAELHRLRPGAMARAKSGGFLTDLGLFHGSNREFQHFDASLLGSATGVGSAREGFWTSVHPAWAYQVAAANARALGGHPQIYPLLARTDNPAVLQLGRHVSDDQIARTLREVFAAGHDLAYLQHSIFGRDAVVTKHANQYRSIFAEFDRAKRESANLMAARGLVLPSQPGEPLDRRAGGGPVRPGVLTLVGERGPELLRLAGAGQVYSHQALRAMLGGGIGGAAGAAAARLDAASAD